MIQDLCLKMERMNCNGCVNRITHVIQTFPGVEILQVDLPSKQVTVRYEPKLLDFAEVEQALAQAKYPIVEMVQKDGVQ